MAIPAGTAVEAQNHGVHDNPHRDPSIHPSLGNGRRGNEISSRRRRPGDTKTTREAGRRRGEKSPVYQQFLEQISITHHRGETLCVHSSETGCGASRQVQAISGCTEWAVVRGPRSRGPGGCAR